jgi:AcrR family transcriptional regulator
VAAKVNAGAGRAEILWHRARKVRAAGKLGYASITQAAMRLADRGGLDALSMRTLAERLGCGTMSLYRYVRGKDDLHDLILDAAFGEIAVAKAVSSDWRRDLSKVFGATRVVMLKHPWLATLLITRPAIGPNYLRWFEFLMEATAAPNRDVLTQVRMIGTVWAFVSGSVAYEAGERENDRRNRLTPAKKRAAVGPYMAGVVGTGKFPQLARYMEAGPAHEPTERDFEFGLRVVLDGLAVTRRVHGLGA